MIAERESNRIVRRIAKLLPLPALLLLLAVGCAKKEPAPASSTGEGTGESVQSSAASTHVSVNTPAAVVAKANAPTPPGSAAKRSSAGLGKAAVNSSDDASDADANWTEQLDVDGDGNMEDTTVLWDDESKVIYYYSAGDFTCTSGGTGNGDMLVAVYGEGNTDARPAGSGWYLVTLDESECGAAAAGAYGCAFDATGNETSCGLAEVDEKTDDLTIVTATTTPTP